MPAFTASKLTQYNSNSVFNCSNNNCRPNIRMFDYSFTPLLSRTCNSCASLQNNKRNITLVTSISTLDADCSTLKSLNQNWPFHALAQGLNNVVSPPVICHSHEIAAISKQQQLINKQQQIIQLIPNGQNKSHTTFSDFNVPNYLSFSHLLTTTFLGQVKVDIAVAFCAVE